MIKNSEPMMYQLSLNYELVTDTTEWRCFRPEHPINSGHMVFSFDREEYFGATYKSAQKYGELMVDNGWCFKYNVLCVSQQIHVIPRYEGDDRNILAYLDYISDINDSNTVTEKQI